MPEKSFSSIKSKLSTRLSGQWSESSNFFLCYLPARIGRLSSWALKLFYSGITIEADQLAVLRQLPRDAIIVYANKRQSHFEFMFFHTRYHQEGLKLPEIGFEHKFIIWQRVSRIVNIILAHSFYLLGKRKLLDPYESGFIFKELANGRSAFLSLVRKKGFYRWFVKTKTDPLQYLLKIQEHTQRPVYIVPQLMFFSRKADRTRLGLFDIFFGTENNPGAIRRLVKLFKNPGKVFVEISDPLSLKQFLSKPENSGRDPEDLSTLLRKQLILQLNRHRQSITGPVIKSTEELKQNILTGERLRGFMEKHAATKQISIRKVHKMADEYLDEIAARYSRALISIGDWVLHRLFKIMFEGISIDVQGLNRMKAASKKGPLVIIPCHKSHIDYLVLAYILYRNHVPLPLIAAGKNLSFWPMGPLFRSVGAFFIRRSFRGAVLYARVFAEYVHKLLQEGFNIEVFIEGGRSRTGKLLTPKLGLLSILLNSVKNGACDNLFFAPIYIGYDRVLEERAYLHELEGGEKKPESFKQFIRTPRFLKRRYGRIYINFHPPLELKQLLTQNDVPVEEMPNKALNAFCRNLGYRVINAIDRVSVVTPHALVAAALLNCPRGKISYQRLVSYLETYINYLLTQKVILADSLLLDQERAIEQVLGIYTQRSFIEKLTTGKDDDWTRAEFRVNDAKRPSLEFYKNNAISFLVPPAITALTILDNDAFQFSATQLHTDYAFLQDFFKDEFSYDIDQAPEYFVRKCIKAFIDDAILMPHPTLPDTYNLTSAGFRRLKRFAGFLKTFFESYWIVLSVLALYPKKSIRAKQRMKKITSWGDRMYKRKDISRKEAISNVNYGNAVVYFTRRGVNGAEDKEQIEFYTRRLQRYLNLLS